jgi:glycosyltransferase involved in cell wall biosynthesis
MTTESQLRLRIALPYDAMWPFVTGGAERRIHEIATRLARRHDVTLVSWQWWDGPSVVTREDGVRLVGLGPAQQLYGADGKRRISEVAAFSVRLMPSLLRHRFDVVEIPATLVAPLLSAAIATALRRAPLVATWHEVWREHWFEYLPDRPLVARAARRMEDFSRRLGAALVVGTTFTAERLRLPPGSPRLRMIPYGTPLDEIDAAEPALDRVEILYVGRLIDEKRVDLLLEALGSLPEPRPRLVIVGEGPERDTLESMANDLGIAGQVTFAGRLPQDQLYGRMRAADLFVLPSVREGYGLVVREGQAAGAVPIVVRAPYSAASTLIDDGIDGVICNPSAPEIAAAIVELLADPGRRAQMARAGRAKAETETWDVAAAAAEALYRELVRPATRQTGPET